jgi:leucyl aminopeptidase (aminopeptidase T)
MALATLSAQYGRRMSVMWTEFAARIVRAAGVRIGELIAVRDGVGRQDILEAVLLAVEAAGAIPIPQITPARYMERLWRTASLSHLAQWHRHRQMILEKTDRIIVLSGDRPDTVTADKQAYAAWSQAEDHLTQIEEARQLPLIMATIPTAKRAYQLGLTLDVLDAHVLPALIVSEAELSANVNVALMAANDDPLTISSGGTCVLTTRRGDRPWMGDDGLIDAADRASGFLVSTLPAGLLSCAIDESSAEGEVLVPQLRGVENVRLTVSRGRITYIKADSLSASARVSSWIDSHSGDPRRVSAVHLGLNPALQSTISWASIDRHLYGRVSICLGDNRHLGGNAVSSLRLDAVLGAEAALRSGDTDIVDAVSARTLGA